MRYPSPDDRLPEAALAEHLAAARQLTDRPPEPIAAPQSAGDLEVDALFHELRWFVMPDEAAAGAGRGDAGRHRDRPDMTHAGTGVPA